MRTHRWRLRAKTAGAVLLVLFPLFGLGAVVWTLTTVWAAMWLAAIGIFGLQFLGALFPGVPDPDALVGVYYWLCPVVGLGAAGYAAVHLYSMKQRLSQELLDDVVTAPATPETQPVLCEAVQSVAQRLDCPVPDVVVAGPDAPSALSIGLKPGEATVLVSSRTLDDLTPAEVEAVVAHELAHLKNRDSTLRELLLSPNALTMAHGVLYFPLLPAFVLYWLLDRVATGTYARVREQVADYAAARVTGNPAALASALETLDEHTVDRPTTDARREAVAALSIVPDTEEFHYGAERDIKPVAWPVQRPIRKAWMRATARHPRTETRIDALRRLEREQERR